ncbi:unnamed protein product [Brassica rapa]|uniref:Uncharacterized protein n=1 Tax=Brassica campestris TaxID=3711 RepID=A0A3P5Z902_BRACM|nr:unnamed protein product [Brassica rapa]VDC70533.1 unnamed protein product [Brassica rapa]
MNSTAKSRRTIFNNSVLIHHACRAQAGFCSNLADVCLLKVVEAQNVKNLRSMANKTSISTETEPSVLPRRSSWGGNGEDHLQTHPFIGTSPH